MARFDSGSEPPIPFSELHPEKFDPARLLDPSNRADKALILKLRKEFMEELVPEPPARPIHANKRRR